MHDLHRGSVPKQVPHHYSYISLHNIIASIFFSTIPYSSISPTVVAYIAP